MYHSVRCEVIWNYLVTGGWDLWSSFVCFLFQTSHSISWILYFTFHTEHYFSFFQTFRFLQFTQIIVAELNQTIWSLAAELFGPVSIVVAAWKDRKVHSHNLDSTADGHGVKFFHLFSFVFYAVIDITL